MSKIINTNPSIAIMAVTIVKAFLRFFSDETLVSVSKILEKIIKEMEIMEIKETIVKKKCFKVELKGNFEKLK